MNLKMFQAVEIAIPSGTTLRRFFFQDQPQLRNAFIQGIQFYTPTVLTQTPVTGATPTSLANMKIASLTLYQGDLQVVFNMPILNLNEIDDGTSPFTWNLPKIENLTISWVKSYVEFTAAPTGATALSMGVYYILPTP